MHSSLWKDGRNSFDGESDTFKRYLAGHIACAAEIAIFLAPNINSYKRYAAASWAPTTLAWGHDNRTCGFRIVGHGQHLRTESRIPGADVNPYLAIAALIAAGLHGIDQQLELADPCTGSAYEGGYEHLPTTLREAAGLWSGSKLAEEAFGSDVVQHYLRMAEVEQDAFDTAVTDWERFRSFERM